MVKIYLHVWLVTVPLIECGDFAEDRKRYYDAKSLQQLFQQISVTYVFDFLRGMGLFYRIWV